ncbi:MAG: RNA polymerase sigma factor [Opitutaceae bacterium]
MKSKSANDSLPSYHRANRVSFAPPARGSSFTRSPVKNESAAAHDDKLVQRFQNGDETAFEEIMRNHREKIYLTCRALLRQHADAEDITQETFIRAHRALANFRGDSSLSTWLQRIAVNLARNHYWFHFRRRRQDTCSLERPLTEGSLETVADVVATLDFDPASAAAANEFAALINTCMERLPNCYREILTHRSILHRSYEEIGAALGINVGTVKSRIARARNRVRTLLSEMCPEFAPEAALLEWFESPRYGTSRFKLAAA